MHGDDQRDRMASDTDGDAPLDTLLPCRKLVVVIGIDDYARLPKLRCAVSDALGVQDLLVRRFGFEAPIAPLTNQAATKPAIEALVDDQLRTLLQPDDALLFFFAGHATTRVARLHHVTVETGYVAPVEARGPEQFADLVNLEDLLRRIGMLPARHIVAVVDACHSGIALGSSVTQYRSVDSNQHRLTRNPSRRVITSARRDELALDSGPIPGHSLFTGSLIHALTSGEADLDGNGSVTVSELALSLRQRVAQASGSRQTPDYGAFYLDAHGEMVFAASSSPGDAKESLAVETGTVVADRYRAVRLLREESAADVFSAIDLRTGANVAMKLLGACDKASLSARRAHLQREVQAMNMIYSRHVPRVLEVTSDKSRGVVLVLEPLEGESLLDRLKRDGPIPFERLHPIIDQVLLGLTDIHKAGVVHRYLMPSNLFLERGYDGVIRLKILDFGICQHRYAKETIKENLMGRLRGTFSFMPREQIGKAKTVDHRADIYACATLIFQALSGQLPYNTRNILELVEMKNKTDARRLSEAMGPVDPGLEAFLARGLERDPAKRFQTSEEALVAWRKLLPGGR